VFSSFLHQFILCVTQFVAVRQKYKIIIYSKLKFLHGSTFSCVYNISKEKMQANKRAEISLRVNFVYFIKL